MKIAITGLVNSGKTTIFNALTGLSLETSIYPSTPSEPHPGLVKVPDIRIDTLSKIYKPKKTTYSTVEYTDFIGISKGGLLQNRKSFDAIKDADALVETIRVFKDEAVVHQENSIDPVRDAINVEMELIFADFDLVEKRITKMEDGSKRGKKPDETEMKLLLKCRDLLEKEIPLRAAGFSETELKGLRHLQFVSIKPKIIVLNMGEGDAEPVDIVSQISQKLKLPPQFIMPVYGKIEMEIVQLPPDEAKEFLDELKIEEPALNKLIRASYSLLGLISFLTSGQDEVRAWTIRGGSTALEAAGKIHSDIERGFIRAEVVSYTDFMAAGTMADARKAGTVRLEGKNYVVNDGDIVNFRFNV
ncbi:MAG: redox-regulated ATPase YchF [Nitrospirae bacterium]|nr:redox-regulated ATPase YchF [Nitrospirota bacterium]MBF0533574.1 redox-regulated ATPase YchF [Nitrospirota bacterium]MBF0618009.1 redox-regulated ATPase YchF [Nitrospirota bacterium]